MDRVIATISRLTGRLSFYCAAHAPTADRLDAALKGKYIFGWIKESEIHTLSDRDRDDTACAVCSAETI